MTTAEKVAYFNKMPIDERMAFIECYTAKNLLDAYDYFREHFDPLDSDFADSYEAIKAEILKRCKN